MCEAVALLNPSICSKHCLDNCCRRFVPQLKMLSKIELLPDEILSTIIGYIHIIDRINIRTVSKKFKTVIDFDLASTDSIQFLGKSIRSMLDFVTDAKKKEIRCKDHYVQGINSIRMAINLEQAASTISTHFLRVKYLRLHKMSLTWRGFKLLTNSTFWTNSLQHLDIKSCYLEDPECQIISGTRITIIDRTEVYNMQKPTNLRHFNLILMSEQADLLFALEYLTEDLKSKKDEGNDKEIIYNVQTPRSKQMWLTVDNGPY